MYPFRDSRIKFWWDSSIYKHTYLCLVVCMRKDRVCLGVIINEFYGLSKVFYSLSSFEVLLTFQ